MTDKSNPCLIYLYIYIFIYVYMFTWVVDVFELNMELRVEIWNQDDVYVYCLLFIITYLFIYYLLFIIYTSIVWGS